MCAPLWIGCYVETFGIFYAYENTKRFYISIFGCTDVNAKMFVVLLIGDLTFIKVGNSETI